MGAPVSNYLAPVDLRTEMDDVGAELEGRIRKRFAE